MLENTFLHLEDELFEEKMWENEIFFWNDLLCNKPFFLKDKKYLKICEKIEISKKNLQKKNLKYFSINMKNNSKIRLYKKSKPLFLDIETTGLEFYHDITVIGTYNGKEVKQFINNKYEKNEFLDYILNYDTIITFNGNRFDLPFISNKLNYDFSNFALIDLMYCARKHNLVGGLKKIENIMGIKRNDTVKNISGYEAVILWKKYKKNNDLNALNTLLKYNEEDIVNLKEIAEKIYKIEKTKFNKYYYK